MNRVELIEKITERKEFSQLPKEDVSLALSKFEKKNLNDYQKVKLTRQLLRKIFSSFSSRKIFSSKEKSIDWYFSKHKSTKERSPFYKEIYSRCLKDFKKVSVIDLGAGINGLSYSFFSEGGLQTNYAGVEGIGQFVNLMNEFFKENDFFKNARAYHLSLFNLDRIKEIIQKQKNPRVIFLFKVIDSLEVLKRDYSKDLLTEIVPLCDRLVLSFATKSLGSRKRFGAQRGWILKFIKENFEILDDFEINGERYISFRKNSSDIKRYPN